MSSKILVVIGAFEDEDHIKRVVKITELGLERWLATINKEEEFTMINELNSLALMKNSQKEEDDAAYLRFRGSSLDVTVLISPTCETVHYELRAFFPTVATRCLIVFSGFITEESADWCLQDGIFSFNNFKLLLQDSKISSTLSENKCKVTVSCCKQGLWAASEESLKSIFPEDSEALLEIMDPLELHTPVDEKYDAQLTSPKSSPEQKSPTSRIEDFSEYLEDGIAGEVGGIFNTLKPPLQEGFLKIRNPCIYIFPGGHGDSAFFAVNGFNLLVNGGASTKPWFWKLIQHVDRVDGILATHLGSDNLPGINSLLLRKLQEHQVKLPMDNTTPEYQEMRRCLISPDIGPLFMNAPAKFLEQISKSSSASSPPKTNGKLNGESATDQKDEELVKHPVLKTVDIVKDTLRLSKALHMEMVPLVRKPTAHHEPITLFSKVGLGRLDMYVLSPAEGSKELTHINEKWGCNGKGSSPNPSKKNGVSASEEGSGDPTAANLASICCLLVWHPSNPHERIVRVLFPGNAPQAKIFEGLESLKALPFMKSQFVTKHTLSKLKNAAKANGNQSGPRTAARPTAGGKKVPSALPKKTAAPLPSKREANTNAGKPADKRPKTDRPSTAKPKPAAASLPAKLAPKLGQKSKSEVSQSTSKPAASGTKKSAASRPGTSAAKPEPKRAASSAAKPGTSKPKPQPAAKTVEKAAKKPATLTPSKSKVDHKKSPGRKPLGGSASVTKTPSKKSPEKGTAPKKVPTKAGNEKSKKKEEPPKVVTPPVDLTPEFPAPGEVQAPSEPGKLAEPLSNGSEEPTNSVLSDRHSPEGEDVPQVEYEESAPVVVEKEVKVGSSAQEKEDEGFVIMSKPEISEESGDFISENGSSMDTPKPIPDSGDAMLKEDALLSSDNSTPTPDEPKKDKVSFVEPEKEEEDVAGSHPGVGRLPTPFHSLQDSSGTTEQSPISESEETSIPVELEREETGGPVQESVDQAEVDSLQMGAAKSADGLLGEDLNEQAKDMASDVHTSFNSSMEGSYELYPTGRSPPPASDRQETIAETISDFKHDETPLAQDYEQSQVSSANLDTQQQTADFIEDQTTSTEAPDPRYSFSTTSTESRLARIDSPFSPSEVGLGHSAVTGQPKPDPAQMFSPKHGLASFRTEDDISSMCGPNADISMSTEAPLSSSNLLISTSAAALPASESVVDLPPNDVIGLEENVETSDQYASEANADDNNCQEKVLIDVHDKENETLEDKEEGKGVEINSSEEEEDLEKVDELLHAEMTSGEMHHEAVPTQAEQDFIEDEIKEKEADNMMEMYEKEEKEYSEDPAATFEPAVGKDFNNGLMQEVKERDDYEMEKKNDNDMGKDNYDMKKDDYDMEKKEDDLYMEKEEEKLKGDEQIDQTVKSAWAESENKEDEKEEFVLHADAGQDLAEVDQKYLEEGFIQEEVPGDDEAPVLGSSEQHGAGEAPEMMGVSQFLIQEKISQQNELDREKEGLYVEDGTEFHKDQIQSGEVNQEEQSDYQEEEHKMQLTGSLASSAQDQHPGEEDSEATSLTETGTTPEMEHPPMGFEYDGPDVQDFEHVEREVITKSDLSLSSPEENFALHGGNNQQFTGNNGQSKYEDDQAMSEHPDAELEPQEYEQPTFATSQRYHPAYVDPTAPLADIEDDMNQGNTGEDSSLDVNAKPFVPQSSFPPDQSPLYATDADLEPGNDFPTNGDYDVKPTSTSTMNPFMVDLLSSIASQPLDLDGAQEPRSPPVRGPDPCAAQDSSKPTKVNPKKTGSASAKKSGVTPPMYFDLAYVPGHANKNSVGLDFFKRVRARYYVISANDQSRDEPSKDVLNHLLEGKRSWLSDSTSSDTEDTNITVIPTHDTATIREWYQQNFKELEACNIHMVASGSKVLMQDDSIEACKIEF